MLVPQALDDGAIRHTFLEAVSGLDDTALRVVHLAISRAVALQSSGRGGDADALLLGLLRLIDDEPSPGPGLSANPLA